MATVRLLHTSDLHLGKRFGSMPEDIRYRLVEARHTVLATLIEIAEREAAAHIMIAGDTFDTETPSDAVRVQALRAMAAAPGLTWWILPGNHDSLRAEPLWDAVRRDAPANVHVLDTPAPVTIAPGVALLPAPWPHPAPGTDLTAPLREMTTPDGAVRIGLAHGATASFHEDADTSALIPPDRAESAGLDYLALGDWHGAVSLGPRMQYSGAPERDGFRHDGRGLCLLVEVSAGSVPQVRQIETGRFAWHSTALTLSPGLDPVDELSRVVPPAEDRRDTLLKLTASGTIALAERGRLDAALQRLIPEFGHLAPDLSDLTTLATAGDLDAIAPTGALRAAAEDLRATSQDGSLSETERRLSARALDRLWTMLQENP